VPLPERGSRCGIMADLSPTKRKRAEDIGLRLEVGLPTLLAEQRPEGTDYDSFPPIGERGYARVCKTGFARQFASAIHCRILQENWAAIFAAPVRLERKNGDFS
jgi:hypothetical protein